MTDIFISARRGAGAPAEILYGTVTFKPTLAHSRSTSIVLPAPTTFDLVDGEVVATNVQPTPEPVEGKIEWAYEVTFKDRHSKTYSFLVGVPDSTTQVNFTSLPRYFETKPPLFGEGPKGEPGEAATVAVGTVTGGATAQVTNSGTNTDAVLDFVLPKGDKGDTGDGVAMLSNKAFADAPSTYPTGVSQSYISSSSLGWPYLNSLIVTDKRITGRTVQTITRMDDNVEMRRTEISGDAWSPFKEVANTDLATTSAAGLMSSTDKSKLDTVGTIAENTKNASDAPSTYPSGTTVTNARTSAGWPVIAGGNPGFTRVVTQRARTINSTIQYATAYVSTGAGEDVNNNAILYRIGRSDDTWGNWQEIAREVVGGYAPVQMAYFNNVRLGQDAMAATNSWDARNNNAFGIGALYSLAQGRYNDAFGLNALYYLDGTGNDPNGTAATRNSAFGSNTQRFNKTGNNNVSFGRNSLQCNVAGANNVAFGAGSMAGLAPLGLNGVIINGTPVNAQRNVAIGVSTLDQTGGGDNVALGYRAAVGIKQGYGNIAIGSYALEKLEGTVGYNGNVRDVVSQSGTFTATGNTVSLTISGHTAQSGDIIHVALSGQERQFLDVTSVGSGTITCTLPYTVTGTLSGTATIEAILRGSNPAEKSAYNIAIGYNALNNLSAYGTTGNLAFGFGAGLNMADGSPNTSSRNCVYLGRNAAVSGDAQVQLGNTAMTVYAQQAIQIRSDARDKADVRDTVLGLDFIEKLRPVDYKWDIRQDYFEYDEDGNIVETPEPDGSKKRSRYHHGLIAQEVEAVIKETGVDFGGFQDHKVNGGSDIKSVGYEELIAPLIKAVQELSAEVKALKEAK